MNAKALDVLKMM